MLQQPYASVYFKWALKTIQVPTTSAGTPPTNRAAKGLIQPGLEFCQDWGIHHLPGQPAPLPQHLYSKKFLVNT